MATIGTLAVNIVAKTGHFTKGITNAQASMARFGKYAAAAGAAAAGLGVAMLRTSETINRAMTKSLAIMGDVSETMRGDMLRAANEVAKTTEKSTAQAAESYYFLAAAGMNAEQSLKAMPVVARFAQAGNFDLALATDLATDAQSALGLSSKDTAKTIEGLTRVTDVLIKANTLANSSAQQFSEALTNGAGAALKIVNKDVEEGVAVLAAYADQGIKGAEAGTAFGIVMRDLQTKAIQNKSAFRAAGVEVFDLNGKMKNLGGIVGDLERLLTGLSDEQSKLTLLQLGFSDKSVKYIQTLIGTSEKIQGYEKALRNAGGASAEVAGKSMTDLQKAIAQLKGSWSELALEVGNAAEKLGLFKAASEAASGTAVLISNSLNPGKKNKDSVDILQEMTTRGGGWNPLNNLREGYEGWAEKIFGIMPNHVDAANPDWTAKNQAALAAAGGSQGGIDAQQNMQVMGKWLAKGLASAQGSLRRGALAGDNALSGIAGMKGKANDALMQQALGQLSFGMAGTPVGSEAWKKRQADIAEKVRQAEEKFGQSGSRSSGTLSFARTGSVESYKQRMAIGKQNEADKIRKKQLKELEEIKRELKKPKNGLAPANF